MPAVALQSAASAGSITVSLVTFYIAIFNRQRQQIAP